MIARKINLLRASNRSRLLGGADISEEFDAKEASTEVPSESVQEIALPSPSLPSLTPTLLTPSPSPVEKSVEESILPEVEDENFQDKQQLLSTSGPCCFCILQTPRSVGDRKVDEIIEYVHQNLEEAGKALAILGENFEHDIKLIFIDILGRIKQWAGIVQNKLDSCKNEVGNLRKELLARACEIDIKTREIEDLKAQLINYQNNLLSNGKIDKSLKKRQKTEPEQKQTEESIQDRPITENAQVIIANGIKRIREIKDAAQIAIEKNEKMRATDQKDGEKTLRVIDRKDEIEARVVYQTSEKDEEDEEQMRVVKDEEKMRKEEGAARIVDLIDKKRNDVTIHASVSIQTVMQEKDKIKRESELESEIVQLRKEYDRVMKERAEYENAIQRALLRGVSSLSVEALKVLRCPPISCCTPCTPCPAAAEVIPPEFVVSCPAKSTKRRPKSAIATVSSIKIPRDRNGRNGDQTNCTMKRPCASPCCSVGGSRKLADGSMIFFLRQNDARNMRAKDEDVTVCESTITKKIEILPPLLRFRM